ncbi:MAG: DUF4252 domain-containing protein [Prevotellaceae bacterium]|jgi:hypothetical protein|nr:DUF4252 domain-containing protein [Prevotellaceae bacterium]
MKVKMIFMSLVCLCAVQVATAQKYNKLFDKYADMEDVTSIYISEGMMSNILPNSIPISRSMRNKLQVFNMVSTKNPQLMAQMQKEFASAVSGKDYKETMRVRDGKEQTRVYVKTKDEEITDLFMLVSNAEKFMAMQILGSFTLDEVRNLQFLLQHQSTSSWDSSFFLDRGRILSLQSTN